MPNLSDIAVGLERGLESYLRQEAREREEERRRRAEERRQSRFERERVLDEAAAAERGIELPGMERVRAAGPRAMVGDEELTLESGAAPGLRTRPTSDTPFLSGERGLFDRRPELQGRSPADGRGEVTGMERALAEEIDAAASAPPGAEPDVEPGALDPETGQFVTQPVFRARQAQGPSIGRFLREGQVEDRGAVFRLSSGQRFEPGAEERRALQEEIDRLMQVRPELSRPEARFLLEGREDVLTYGREDGLDDTFNVMGREYRTAAEARAAREELGLIPGEGGRESGGRSLTQTQQVARQYGFDTVADYRRFQDRMRDLGEVYGNTQGDPLLQRALEARARGLSEREVLSKIRQDAQAEGFEGEELEAVIQDVRRFFGQRLRREVGALESGNLGDIPDYGSGFDMEFQTPADTSGTVGNARSVGRGGRGPLRNRR